MEDGGRRVTVASEDRQDAAIHHETERNRRSVCTQGEREITDESGGEGDIARLGAVMRISRPPTGTVSRIFSPVASAEGTRSMLAP